MPAATHSYTIDALKGQAVTKQLRDTVTEIQNRIGQRLFDRAARFTGCVVPCTPGNKTKNFKQAT
jgi:glycogen(starch) synthase